eukprot:TRINITY_DN989_c0_g1_i1.p1 TRINITY_DN989_c0_g1~~TRINITY_DN989_c0_g1_i1.p1  ORF type:complete len:637 (+),score=47.31 TRINITY_DN989_c0_g1_i1:8241-10151(+)
MYGICSNAYMNAVQRLIELNKFDEESLEVTQEDFINAVQHLKPSLSEDQLLEYEKLKVKLMSGAQLLYANSDYIEQCPYQQPFIYINNTAFKIKLQRKWMLDSIFSKLPSEVLNQIVDALNGLRGSSRGAQRKATCADPNEHKQLCKDVIDYVQTRGGNEKHLYRELYKSLAERSAKVPRAIKARVDKMKAKYELRERKLFLNGEKTACKHLCLYHKIKDIFIPSKAEIQTLFDIAHKVGHSWSSIKDKLVEMQVYNSSSAPLFKSLCNKCEECKGIREEAKRKGRERGRRVGQINRAQKRNDIHEEIEAKSIESNTKKSRRKLKKIEDKEEIKEDISCYPLKQISLDVQDQSWIGVLLHLLCSIPEIALSLISAVDGEFSSSMKDFVKNYWKLDNTCLVGPPLLHDYVKKLSRNDENYKDFWQTLLSLAFHYESQSTENTERPLSQLFVGETVHPAIKDTKPFLYLSLKISKDTDLIVEMTSWNRKFSKVPPLFSIVVDRTDLSTALQLPLELDTAKFSLSEKEAKKYKLCHMVCCCLHEGGVPHFFSYILSPVNEKWFMVRESGIELIDPSKIDFSHVFFAVYRQEDAKEKLQSLIPGNQINAEIIMIIHQTIYDCLMQVRIITVLTNLKAPLE